MERLIDISNFFIVSIADFNNLILKLNCNLSQADTSYLATYLIANLFAIIIIFLFIYVLIKIKKKIFRKRRYF